MASAAGSGESSGIRLRRVTTSVSVGLAGIQLVDGLLCLRPVSFVASCLDDVHLPRRFWGWLPPIKFAAASGLLLGARDPRWGALTGAALTAYFATAVSMHIRARDLHTNARNASGLLVLSALTTALNVAAARRNAA